MIRRRLLARARRLLDERPDAPSELVWPRGVRLTGLVPVKPGRGGNVVNKAGRVVLRGMLDGEPVKVYEAWSEEHAAFIAALPSPRFPRTRARHGRCIVAPWIPGVPDEAISLEALIELQNELHAISASTLPPPGFDFWRDFLRPRFVRAADMVGERVEDVLGLVDERTATGERVLIHPDLRPVNLVGGTIIDNESVTTSSFPLLDVVHTAHGLKDRGSAFWRLSCARRGTPSRSELDVLRAVWVARLAGSRFVAGTLGGAADVLRRYRAGQEILPF